MDQKELLLILSWQNDLAESQEWVKIEENSIETSINALEEENEELEKLIALLEKTKEGVK